MISNYVKNMIPSLVASFETLPIKKAWLFGSCSRGEENQASDVDLLVQYDRQNNKVGLITIIKIQQQLEQLLGRNVDLVEDGSLLPFATETANHDKVLIYERND